MAYVLDSKLYGIPEDAVLLNASSCLGVIPLPDAVSSVISKEFVAFKRFHHASVLDMEASRSVVKQCMLRPVVSSDGAFLAVITRSLQLHILELRGTNGRAILIHVNNFPPRHRRFLQDVSHLTWAPEVVLYNDQDDNTASNTSQGRVQAWLLLADSNRVIVLSLSLDPGCFVEQNAEQTKANIIADYEYPDYYGKLTSIEFVFNHTCAIVLFDIFDCACLQHFDEAQRDDIPARKFATKRGYAKTSDGKYLAVLLREHQKDRLAILDKANLVACFDVGSVDAQGFQWSPDDSPYLGVWDTSSSSTNIKFYSATGQCMSALEIDASNFSTETELPGTSGLGVSALSWTRQHGSDNHAIMAVSDGSGRVLHRVLKPRSITVVVAACVEHRATLDPAKTTIWQEIGMGEFRREEGLWTLSTENTPDVDMIALSPGGSLFATRIAKEPNVLFVWKSGRSQPLTVILFQHRVRQALWHPAITTALIMLTARDGCFVNLWYESDRSPLQRQMMCGSPSSTVGWEAQWIVQCAAKSSGELFMISSSREFEVGHLGIQGDELVFRSLHDDTHSSEQDDLFINETPSRPSKRDRFETSDLITSEENTYWLCSKS